MFLESPKTRNSNGNIQRAGWVLTGGRSSRMGFDKALAEVDGLPLAVRVARRLAAVCDSVSLVGDPAQYGHLDLPVVPDSFPGQGPLAGIEAALEASPVERNLIVACDMPALDPATMEALFASPADCTVPQYPDSRLEPLCAVYSKHCHSCIRAALEVGTRKVTEALRELERQGFALSYLQVTNRESFANLNTPDDLRLYNLQQHTGGRRDA